MNLCHWNIALFRQLGILFVAGSGVFFAWTFRRFILKNKILSWNSPSLDGFFFYGFIIIGSLLYYLYSLPSISYNMYASICSNLAAGFLLLALPNLTENSSKSFFQKYSLPFLSGLLTGILFFPKFSASIPLLILLLFFSIIWLLRTSCPWQKILFHNTSIIVGFICWLCFNFLFIQSYPEWFHVLSYGIYALTLLQSPHNHALERYFEETCLTSQGIFNRLGGLIFTTLLTGILLNWLKVSRIYWQILFLICFAGYLISYLFPAGLDSLFNFAVFNPFYVSFIVLLILLQFMLVYFHLYRKEDQANRIESFLNWKYILIAFFLFALPVASAFGTSNPLLSNMMYNMAPFFCLFWLMLYKIAGLQKSSILSTIIGIVIATVASIQILGAGNLTLPYRVATVYSLQNIPTQFGEPASSLLLDNKTHQVIENLKNAAYKNGFKPGDDILSFYNTPGLVYALGGKSPGFPWYFGGYPGTKISTEYGLQFIPADRLKRAFILEDTDNTPQFAMPDLQRWGIHFPKDYILCGQFFWPITQRTFRLWKPGK